MKTVSSPAVENRIVRPKEAQRILGRSATSLWRDEKAGRIPPRRVTGPGARGWLLLDLINHIENLPEAG